MPASPTENRKEQSANEDQIDYENDALNWEEIEIDIGWGTVRGKAIGNGPHHMLGEYAPKVHDATSNTTEMLKMKIKFLMLATK